ncbi:MAG: DUF6754 domain-containing protein [Candidatus Bathyarchaeia archaeon]
MAIIIAGRVIAFIFLLACLALFYIYMELAKRGTKISIRTFPAVAALPEAVGRAAEMGRPLYYTTGYAAATISNPDQGPQTLAGISILGYVTKLAARSGVKVYYFTCIPDSLPLVEETMRNAYLEEGKPEDFDPNFIQFQSEQSPYLTATLGFMQRERPAANIFMGGFYYESVVMGEAGNTIGAMQIAGTANTHQMPFLIATCDYAMISEELYAASADITRNPDILGTLKGEDIMKLVILALLGVGFLISFTGSTFLIELLGM